MSASIDALRKQLCNDLSSTWGARVQSLTSSFVLSASTPVLLPAAPVAFCCCVVIPIGSFNTELAAPCKEQRASPMTSVTMPIERGVLHDFRFDVACSPHKSESA